MEFLRLSVQNNGEPLNNGPEYCLIRYSNHELMDLTIRMDVWVLLRHDNEPTVYH